MEKSPSRVALAFAYDGTRFDSFARQPRRRTVEGELLALLGAARMIRDPRAQRFQVASRTDRGVSAWWNVCAFDTETDPRTIPHLRETPEGLHLLSAVACPSAFSPRRDALERRYVYHLRARPGFDWRAVRAGTRLFRGVHDFGNFSRRDEGVDPVRRLTRLSLLGRGDDRHLRVVARSFLWEQVRRIVHALVSLGLGERTLASVRDQLASGKGHSEPPAPPEPLVLERVETPLSFPPISGAAQDRLEAALDEAWARWKLHAGLAVSSPTRRR